MKIVFIVGAPRSGTTFLQRKLAETFGFRTLPETHFFSQMLPKCPQYLDASKTITEDDFLTFKSVADAYDLHFPDFGTYNSQTLFEALVRANVQDLQENELIIEKTPHHGRHLSDICQFYPDAQFIHIVRHPINSVSSIYDLAKKYPEKWNVKSLKSAANEWRKNVFFCISRYNYGNIYQIKYEELVTDVDYFLHSLIQKLNLGAYIQTDAVPQDIVVRPFEAWKQDSLSTKVLDRNEVWRERLTAEEASWLESFLAYELLYLGYSRKTPKLSSPTTFDQKLKHYIKRMIGRE